MEATLTSPDRVGLGAVVVDLVDIDEDVLADLIAAAVADTAPDEVTPPLDADGSAGTWTDARLDWMRELYRTRRAGLEGPHQEATWAVRADGRHVGAVRLKRAGDAGVLETGIWLTRSARGRGVAVAAVGAAVERAGALGASAVYAQTTLGNVRAQGVLRKVGFVLSRGKDADEVRALLRLTAKA